MLTTFQHNATFTGISKNTQSKWNDMIYTNIDWVCLGFQKQCIVGYSSTSPIKDLSAVKSGLWHFVDTRILLKLCYHFRLVIILSKCLYVNN